MEILFIVIVAAFSGGVVIVPVHLIGKNEKI